MGEHPETILGTIVKTCICMSEIVMITLVYLKNMFQIFCVFLSSFFLSLSHTHTHVHMHARTHARTQHTLRIITIL